MDLWRETQRHLLAQRQRRDSCREIGADTLGEHNSVPTTLRPTMCRLLTNASPPKSQQRAQVGRKEKNRMLCLYLPVILLKVEVLTGRSELRLLGSVADQLVCLDAAQQESRSVESSYLLLDKAPKIVDETTTKLTSGWSCASAGECRTDQIVRFCGSCHRPVGRT